MNTQTVLVVEDDENILFLVKGYLEREGFIVLTAEDGQKGLEVATGAKPALVVLDLMLPVVDGLEVCRQLRRESTVPILMLTARTEEADRLVGLGIGADDYLTKPFSPRELVARVKALLRRVSWDLAGPPEGVLTYGGLRIDLANRQVLKRGSPLQLTMREFDLLRVLSSRPFRVYKRQELLERCWGYEAETEVHAVDVHMSNLRRKLEDEPSNPVYIQTVRGVGYRFTGGES